MGDHQDSDGKTIQIKTKILISIGLSKHKEVLLP